MIDATNYDKPIWTLTIAEFLDVQRTGLQASLKELISGAVTTVKEEAIPKTDTLGVEEAALLTGYNPKTLYSKVCRRQMPTVSRGRPLIFSRKELQIWLRVGKPTVAQMEIMRRNGEI